MICPLRMLNSCKDTKTIIKEPRFYECLGGRCGWRLDDMCILLDIADSLYKIRVELDEISRKS